MIIIIDVAFPQKILLNGLSSLILGNLEEFTIISEYSLIKIIACTAYVAIKAYFEKYFICI